VCLHTRLSLVVSSLPDDELATLIHSLPPLATCRNWQHSRRLRSQLQCVHQCKDKVSSIEWSSDSLYILCAMNKRGLVEVWSIEDPVIDALHLRLPMYPPHPHTSTYHDALLLTAVPQWIRLDFIATVVLENERPTPAPHRHPDPSQEWTCRIDEGSAGLMAARWSPDGRHVLTSADFQLRTTVWSLVSQQVHYLKFPKFPCKVGCAFSGDGAYMAVLERSECKDRIGIFACKTWDMVGNFAIATTVSKTSRRVCACACVRVRACVRACVWNKPISET
jgi:WD40 repeat protein